MKGDDYPAADHKEMRFRCAGQPWVLLSPQHVMATSLSSVQQTLCTVREVRWSVPMLPCDRCGAPVPRRAHALRTAIDLDLDHPVLLHVTVSVHYCRPCRHYFRAQPPFLRRDAIYTTRVVRPAVDSVYRDGLAMRRVAQRLARDFWVRPSEAMIRVWCRVYSANVDFTEDYQPWVIREFSGVLCVDEVYQGRLALLLAVDPAAPDGDRLMGYALVEGPVDRGAMTSFLTRLRALGVVPDQVISDGARLYPAVLAAVWPTAAQQLCLFHETRLVTAAADTVIRSVSTMMPTPPPATQRRITGPARTDLLAPAATGPVAERRRWRHAARQAGQREVHALRAQGASLTAIAKQTGFNYRTIVRWLQLEVPATESPTLPVLTLAEVQAQEEAPAPPPWRDWPEVRQVRHDLVAGRGLLWRRPDHLTTTEQAAVQALLDSPVGPTLRLARTFLEDWYAIWRETDGARRSWEAPHTYYEQWHRRAAASPLAPLRTRARKVGPARFDRLRQFLRHPTWEATNNGAERTGRAFRQGQGPHFNLRTPQAIEGLLKTRACLQKAAALAPSLALHGRRTRGRRPRQRARAA
jgi:hypothetical protein